MTNHVVGEYELLGGRLPCEQQDAEGDQRYERSRSTHGLLKGEYCEMDQVLNFICLRKATHSGEKMDGGSMSMISVTAVWSKN